MEQTEEKEWVREDGYRIKLGQKDVDFEALHSFLSISAYWCIGVTRERVERSVKCSIPFSLFSPEGKFIGFARLNTDFAHFCYISDVYVDKQHRKKGLSKWLMGVVMETHYVRDVRTVFLLTRSAHELYKKFGFENKDGLLMTFRPSPPPPDVGHLEESLVSFN